MKAQEDKPSSNNMHSSMSNLYSTNDFNNAIHELKLGESPTLDEYQQILKKFSNYHSCSCPIVRDSIGDEYKKCSC